MKSLLFLLAVLAVYFLALRHFGTNKNVFSILAAVGALPTGRSIVETIMLLRARGASQAVREAVSGVKGLDPKASGYDLCLTAYETTYSLSHAAAGKGRVIGYTESASTDPAQCARYIESMLAKDGLAGYRVLVYTDLAEYRKALGNIISPAPGEGSGQEEDEKAMELLYAISL